MGSHPKLVGPRAGTILPCPMKCVSIYARQPVESIHPSSGSERIDQEMDPLPWFRGSQTHLRDPLEQDRLVPRALREAKGAHRPGGLVLVGREEVVQALVAQVVQEPFSWWRCVSHVCALGGKRRGGI